METHGIGIGKVNVYVNGRRTDGSGNVYVNVKREGGCNGG
jgi:hypothetical protein